jgi:predicted component of type VI protein secretion system
VRRGFRLLGVAAYLRDVGAGEWREALGPGVEDLLLPNPYEVAA